MGNKQDKINFINFRITETDKAAFESFAKSVGLSSSSILTAFIKKCINLKKIPFEFSEDEKTYAQNLNTNDPATIQKAFVDSLNSLKDQIAKLELVSKGKLSK
jgi:addiction module RelB/DinJ family antitoxin